MQMQGKNRMGWIVLFLLIVVQARAADITGIITSAQTGEPLHAANVFLIGTQIGSSTNLRGEYILENVKEGQYEIKVTYMGYKSVLKSISVAGENLALSFKLEEDFFLAESVVVTATRTDKLLEDVPVTTEFIAQAEIVQKGAEDVAEILEDRPGITVETGASGGKFIYMNGIDSKRVLILKDGVPLSGKLNDRNDLNLIDSDQVDHVEIVKGPGSALFGSEAMGGVVNIVTKGLPKNFEIEFNGRSGSNELYSGGFTISGMKNNLGLKLNVDHFQKGLDQFGDNISVTNAKSNRFGGELLLSDSPIGRLEFNGEYKEDSRDMEVAFMGRATTNISEVDHKNMSLRWNRSLGRKMDGQIIGYYSDNFRTYETVMEHVPAGTAVDTTTDRILGVKSDFSWLASNRFKVDFGADYSTQDYDSPRIASEINRNQIGVFGQTEIHPIKKMVLTLGARYDKISDLDGHLSPRISAMMKFSSNLKLRASWGEGFRAPSFIELFSDFPLPIPGMPITLVGNGDLKPEVSRGGQLGIESQIHSKVLLNVTAFQNQFTDMIVDYQKDMTTFSYLNVEKAKFTGVEFQSRIYFLNNLTSTISYNYTHIDNRDEDVAFSKIAPHTAAFRLNYSLFNGKMRFSFRDQFFSKRDILVYTGPMSGYVVENKGAYNLIDLTLSYKFHSLLTVRVGVDNVTDYTDEDYGPWLGRKFFVSINSILRK